MTKKNKHILKIAASIPIKEQLLSFEELKKTGVLIASIPIKEQLLLICKFF